MTTRTDPFPPGFVRHTVIAVMCRPRLWWTAVAQYKAFVAPRWWARRPPLPVPDKKYLQFRLETQYGLEGTPEVRHVIEYLEWCREMRSVVATHNG